MFQATINSVNSATGNCTGSIVDLTILSNLSGDPRLEKGHSCRNVDNSIATISAQTLHADQ